MSDRRVVLGKRLDGSFGLDVSLGGTDALTDDRNNVNKFSFSSDWQDTVRVSQFGKINVPLATSNPDPYLGSNMQVAIPNWGYIPHFEARGWDGANRVYDDTWEATDAFGLFCQCFQSTIDFRKFGTFTYNVVYLIYRYPLDQQ